MHIIGQNKGRIGKFDFGMCLPLETRRLLASSP